MENEHLIVMVVAIVAVVGMVGLVIGTRGATVTSPTFETSTATSQQDNAIGSAIAGRDEAAPLTLVKPVSYDRSAIVKALKDSLYTVNKQQTFNGSVYAPQLVIKCNVGDLVVSGSCQANPSVGGNVVFAQPVLPNYANAVYGYANEFQCVGPVYGATGRYSFSGTAICLKA